jgi:hypothetical protein
LLDASKAVLFVVLVTHDRILLLGDRAIIAFVLGAAKRLVCFFLILIPGEYFISFAILA